MINNNKFYETFKGIRGFTIKLNKICDTRVVSQISQFLNLYLNVELYTQTRINENDKSFIMEVHSKDGIDNVLTNEVADIVINELKYINRDLYITKKYYKKAI